MNIQSAHEAAERLRRIHEGAPFRDVYDCDYHAIDYDNPYNVDMREAFGLLLAILEDPSAMIPEPVWERLSENECWRWHPTPWNYYAGNDYWLVTGPGCNGFTVDCDSLESAKVACVADFRERVRGMFQETKKAPAAP